MLSIGEFARLGQVSPRTLRHYGDLGVLVPAHVEPTTGYRYYELRQLSDLRRVLALRDLGVGLEQIRELTAEDGTLPVEQLRGMLRLRRAEISASISEDRQRLRRVASYLDAIERGDVMRTIDVVVKNTDPLRMAETTGVAPGYGHENIAPVFRDRLPVVWLRLHDAGVWPGKSVAYFEWPDDDSRVVVHLGFDIADQALPDTDEVRAVELRIVEVASALHHGRLDDISDTFEAVVRWIDDNGYRIAGFSRELYLEWDEQDPSRNLTELQLPISRTEGHD